MLNKSTTDYIDALIVSIFKTVLKTSFNAIANTLIKLINTSLGIGVIPKDLVIMAIRKTAW